MVNSKKGLTLIELLGSLVLLGILVSLLTASITVYIRSTNESIRVGQVQTEGLLLVRTVESRINNFIPSGVKNCDDEESLFSFEEDNEFLTPSCFELTSSVVDRQPLEIRLENDRLFIDNVPIDFRNLEEILEDIVIVVERFDQNTVINIRMSFEGSGNQSITFITNNLFRITIPINNGD